MTGYDHVDVERDGQVLAVWGWRDGWLAAVSLPDRCLHAGVIRLMPGTTALSLQVETVGYNTAHDPAGMIMAGDS